MKYSVFTIVTGAALAMSLNVAQAVTFTYDVAVTESEIRSPPPDTGEPVFSLPSVGTTGTISVTLNDTMFGGSSEIPMPGTDLTSLLSVTARFDNLATSVIEPALFQFGNGDLSITSLLSNLIELETPNFSGFSALAGSFNFTPGAGVVAPTTLSEFEAILASPDTSVLFKFNGDIEDVSFASFIEFEASGALAPPAVPLPASGLLLLGGLGGLGVLRRRRSTQAAN